MVTAQDMAHTVAVDGVTRGMVPGTAVGGGGWHLRRFWRWPSCGKQSTMVITGRRENVRGHLPTFVKWTEVSIVWEPHPSVGSYGANENLDRCISGYIRPVVAIDTYVSSSFRSGTLTLTEPDSPI